MKRPDWIALFANQPPGLSVAELARRINQNPQLTAYWVRTLKYAFEDGRLHPAYRKFNKLRKVEAAIIDFSEPNNAVLAEKHGLSRQRIWQLRKDHASLSLCSNTQEQATKQLTPATSPAETQLSDTNPASV